MAKCEPAAASCNLTGYTQLLERSLYMYISVVMYPHNSISLQKNLLHTNGHHQIGQTKVCSRMAISTIKLEDNVFLRYQYAGLPDCKSLFVHCVCIYIYYTNDGAHIAGSASFALYMGNHRRGLEIPTARAATGKKTSPQRGNFRLKSISQHKTVDVPFQRG